MAVCRRDSTEIDGGTRIWPVARWEGNGGGEPGIYTVHYFWFRVNAAVRGMAVVLI